MVTAIQYRAHLGWFARGLVLWTLIPAALPTGQLLVAQPPDTYEFFEKSIRPLLAENCYACHSAKTVASGGLTLDTKRGLRTGGSRGQAVVPGTPDTSLLLRVVRHEDANLKMPPTGKLSDSQIEDLRRWVQLGAPDPRTEDSLNATNGIDWDEARRYWAFQPLRDPSAPAVDNERWVQTFIDPFVLAKLEDKSLAPAPPAEKGVWLRRVTFDLTGLPPTPREIENFLADRSPHAYRTVVERLLASPHYGEKWARHWLDLVRFGETMGHEFDPDQPDAWRYRDYVIRAFNSDLPYDDFVREHLAGDLLARQRLAPDGQHWDSPLGTGFYALGEERNAADDVGQVRANRIDNQIDVYGKTFLGLTLGCARCHDHKFDPITVDDYYALAGVMESTQTVQRSLDSPATIRRMRKIAEEMVEINGQIASMMRKARLERLHEVKAYLLAAAAIVVAENSPRRAADDVPKPDTFGLDPETVERWVDVLKRADKQPDHVFYPLAQLVKPLPRSQQGKTFPERVAELRAELAEWEAKAGIAHESNAERGDVIFADFEQKDFGDWRASGPAFDAGPSRYHAPNQALSDYRGTDLANSFGSGSDEWVGTLTSKSFAMTKPYLHVRIAGSERRTSRAKHGKLYFSLVTSGRFRPLTADGSGTFEWKTINVKRTPGQVSYIEIVDRARDAHIVVDKIIFSDSKEPPAVSSVPNPRVVEMLADSEMQSLEDLATGYQELLRKVLVSSLEDPAGKWLASAVSPTGMLEDPTLLVGESQRSAFKELNDKRAELGESIPDTAFGLINAEDTPRNARIHVRGRHTNLGDEVPRRFLRVLSDGESTSFEQGSGRLELAEATTGVAGGLAARVMVNRIWKHYFGRGLVATVDNFGNTGRRPTHPALLDALASNFISNGWSVKDLHRSIVLSATYQMSSEADPRAAELDGENLLLQHMPVRRLEAEAIRDSVLAVTGTLNRALYGPSVTPFISPYQDGRGKPESGPLDSQGRRSIYIKVQRNFINPMFLAFDYPVPVLTRGRRTVSTVPSQALILMNNEFVARQVERWADREIAASEDRVERIKTMFLRAFGRPAEQSEIADAEEFMEEQLHLYGTTNRDDYRSWADFGHVLINSKEFIFIR